ncbi:phosphatase PAP2 family protein [Streptomyces sp. ISL-96]|uniref:phosphatase PAP2 family protein n=1 Tax=Streptomyces sp. ISL-96 TaxID=2819191 RepID=UPI001BE97CE3|nr:phosphatase PAP2 family protein [Streptomyces sp. ISL-96]MBT2493941.1 phosphatase PAP2 family protein [Streptomyces sp. ISL-96]
MNPLCDLRLVDRKLTRRAASWDSASARQVLSAVESAAEKTKLWWGIAVVMAAVGGRTERKAAVAGVAGMLTAQVIGNAVCKQLFERRRPPADLIPHDDVEERPDSSSFPSGHTAAAVGLTATVAFTSPWWGTAAAVPAAMVAVERVHSGAHYPSDVAVGTVIGLVSAWLVNRAPRLLLGRLL